MVIVPLEPAVSVAVTTPAATVAIDVLLETQLATLVISADPLHVLAVAVKDADGLL
jgi:hypothetical protein